MTHAGRHLVSSAHDSPRDENRGEASYCFTREAARLIGKSALEDLMDPGGSGRGIAVVVLGVQCAVGKAAIGLLLFPLLLQQVSNGVEQVV